MDPLFFFILGIILLVLNMFAAIVADRAVSIVFSMIGIFASIYLIVSSSIKLWS